MQNRQLQRIIYHIQHRYMTMNNVVVVIAAAIAISWAWASIGVVQKNYALQREVDDKHRQLQLVQLQTDNLAFEQKYYKSSEYLSLEVHRRLGQVDPGEHVLILPPNSATAKADSSDTSKAQTVSGPVVEPSNAQQWANFLFGANSAKSS